MNNALVKNQLKIPNNDPTKPVGILDIKGAEYE